MATVIPAKKKPQQSGDKQNVQVVVRVRPFNGAEVELQVKSIVKCLSQRELMVKEKKFSFDRVFRPGTNQLDVYLAVVAPMIPDVIAGYNCTVFAYGQTGSGKTYTMTGDHCHFVENWKTDQEAGCILRAAAHIFEELEAARYESNVKVSYLELYNEEIRDLLSNDEVILPIYNDPKGSVFIQGLTEVSVHNSEGLCKQLIKGVLKRQTAPTLMNHQSSRSHTVFTITVHTRESSISGEDILKTGKINLVDLAGSENIARSGCKDMRAVELANINKSLLTLGRVIHALADKAQKHVPYRDSKLTRILQDSLGGHTKTAIIATISQAISAYEETISTLDYASRARDIKNTPIINEKMTKAQMVQGLLTEIEKLRKDLDAARDKSGFFVDKENYEKLIETVELITGEKLTMEELSRKQSKRIRELEQMVDTKSKEFDDTIEMCKRSKELLAMAKAVIKEKKASLIQERYVARAYEAHASQLHREAEELLTTTKILSEERGILQDKLQKQYHINITNENTARTAIAKVLEMLEKISSEKDRLRASDANVGMLCRDDIAELRDEVQESLEAVKKVLDDFDRSSIEHFPINDTVMKGMNEHMDNIRLTAINLKQKLEEQSKCLVKMTSVDMPELVQRFKEETRTFIVSTHNMVEKMIEIAKDSDARIASGIDYLEEQIRTRQEEDEALFRSRREKDKEMLNHIQQLRNMISAGRTSKEENFLTELFDHAHKSSRTTTNMLSEVSQSIKAAYDLVLPPPDVVKVVDLTTELCVKLDAALVTVEEALALRTEKDLDKLSQSVIKNVEIVSGVLDAKVKAINSRIDCLLDDREAFEQSIGNSVERTNEVLTQEFLNKVVPVRHEGDTPLRKTTVITKSFDPQAPREALIERFMQEKAQGLEEISDSDLDTSLPGTQ